MTAVSVEALVFSSRLMMKLSADRKLSVMAGFGFNVLTLYSDADKRRADLYYADPLELFTHCRLTFSRFVTLLHDYPLYEFTLLVRH